jgi:hypothetical protein
MESEYGVAGANLALMIPVYLYLIATEWHRETPSAFVSQPPTPETDPMSMILRLEV